VETPQKCKVGLKTLCRIVNRVLKLHLDTLILQNKVHFEVGKVLWLIREILIDILQEIPKDLSVGNRIALIGNALVQVEVLLRLLQLERDWVEVHSSCDVVGPDVIGADGDSAELFDDLGVVGDFAWVECFFQGVTQSEGEDSEDQRGGEVETHVGLNPPDLF